MRREALDQPIHHLALVEEWTAAERSGCSTVSTRGATLDEVGFVHAAFTNQLEAVANRFYADVEVLVVVTIDPTRVSAPIVVEAARDDSSERFPHLYGPLELDAVASVAAWARDDDGRFRLASIGWATT